MADDARSEEPTPRKLQRARQRGDVAHSPLLSAAVVLAAVGLVIAWGGGAALDAWLEATRALWAEPTSAGEAAWSFAALAGRVLAPPLAAAVLAAAVAGLVQVGPLLAPGALRPDPSRLSARLDGAGILARLGRLALAAPLLLVGALVMYAALRGTLGQPGLTPRAVLEAAGVTLGALAWRGVGVLLLAGLIAYVFARWRHHERMRMTRRELREERRRAEGDPEMKRRRARRRRRLALTPSVAEAAAAAALVVHGERVSVAIAWDGGDAVPAVALVARGPAADALRRTARDVPARRDAALAALLAPLDAGASVPRGSWRRLAAALLEARGARR